MSSTNRLPPAVEGPGPFEFEVREEDAPANEKVWRLKVENGCLEVQTWNDEKIWHDTLVVERTGAVARVRLGPMPDLRLLIHEHPALAAVMPIVRARRRLIEVGAGGEALPPMLIHTKTAARVWPVFGMAAPCPPAGAASFFDVMAVWAPALDQFIPDPDAN